jgi:hypothetical protein
MLIGKKKVFLKKKLCSMGAQRNKLRILVGIQFPGGGGRSQKAETKFRFRHATAAMTNFVASLEHTH